MSPESLVYIPPLRERREDIPLLAWAMVNEFGKIFGKTIESIPKKKMDALMRYHWPGNIRELRNMVERAMILNNGPTLFIEVPEQTAEKGFLMKPLEEIERNHIVSVLEYTRCRIRGKGCAAEILGVLPTTLEAKMKKLGIRRKVLVAPKE